MLTVPCEVYRPSAVAVTANGTILVTSLLGHKVFAINQGISSPLSPLSPLSSLSLLSLYSFRLVSSRLVSSPFVSSRLLILLPVNGKYTSTVVAGGEGGRVQQQKEEGKGGRVQQQGGEGGGVQQRQGGEGERVQQRQGGEGGRVQQKQATCFNSPSGITFDEKTNTCFVSEAEGHTLRSFSLHYRSPVQIR